MSTETNVKQIVEISANLAQQNIAALTKPLQESFNIDSVAYVKISQQGKYQAVSNRVDMLENFFTNKIYLESPLLLQAKYKKVPHIKIWRQRDFEDPQFMRYMRFFYESRLAAGLSICLQHNTHVECFYLAMTKKIDDQVNYFTNIVEELLFFTQFFSREIKPVLQENNDRCLDLSYLLTNNRITYPKQNKFVEQLKPTQKSAFNTLSKREKECVEHLIHGLTMKKMATAMNISVKTIEYHLQNVRMKLECKNKSEVIQKAFAENFVAV